MLYAKRWRNASRVGGRAGLDQVEGQAGPRGGRRGGAMVWIAVRESAKREEITASDGSRDEGDEGHHLVQFPGLARSIAPSRVRGPVKTTPSPRPTRAPSFFFLAAQRILLSCCPTNSRSLLSTCTPHLPCPPAPLTVHTRTRARAHTLLSFSSPPPFSLNISVKICRSGQTGPDEQTSPERRASCLTAR